ncbi:MAG: hypothetical protein KIT80_08580 [Chitinophagaceae bacterium]|nr:hypothetical protein [Chitinophagaceae bacterium]MCW5926951.1 hypothetical protein [Chitinophagaceae bacterium]
MRWLCTLLFMIFLSSMVNAQKKLFVRVFDQSGKKISQGHIVAVTDSSLHLNVKRKGAVDLMVTDIGKIKTKRPAGRNIWIGALAGVGAGAIIGGISHQPSEDVYFKTTLAEDILVGALVIGPLIGAAVGGVIALLNNPKIFIIKGSIENWKDFQSHAEEKLAIGP